MLADAHEIYERYARDVHRFVLYLSGDPALADDITADTFVRLWTAPGEIRTATVKAYLFTIARNLYLTSQRREPRDGTRRVVNRSGAES
jgi:RNA polymerase sigma factor (sigma-70 family)